MPPGASAPRKQAAGGRNGAESPVYAFLEKPSLIDYPGSLCGVFFLSGCNFACGFCHNASLMGAKQKGLPWNRLEEVCNRFKTEWVDAVCITGGEPTLAADLIELIKFFRGFGFKVKLDTNGGCPAFLKECLPLVDYVAMDIKTGLTGYPGLTGFKDTDKIRESVRLIMTGAKDYEFRTTVIEPVHTDDQMREIGELIKGAKRYALQAFVPQDTLPGQEFRSLKRTRPDRLRELQKLMTPYADAVIVRGA